MEQKAFLREIGQYVHSN